MANLAHHKGLNMELGAEFESAFVTPSEVSSLDNLDEITARVLSLVFLALLIIAAAAIGIAIAIIAAPIIGIVFLISLISKSNSVVSP